jgi:hypothetical protein
MFKHTIQQPVEKEHPFMSDPMLHAVKTTIYRQIPAVLALRLAAFPEVSGRF